jgi:hypothetical protein
MLLLLLLPKKERKKTLVASVKKKIIERKKNISKTNKTHPLHKYPPHLRDETKMKEKATERFNNNKK